jgi:hypothetical protein
MLTWLTNHMLIHSIMNIFDYFKRQYMIHMILFYYILLEYMCGKTFNFSELQWI